MRLGSWSGTLNLRLVLGMPVVAVAVVGILIGINSIPKPQVKSAASLYADQEYALDRKDKEDERLGKCISYSTFSEIERKGASMFGKFIDSDNAGHAAFTAAIIQMDLHHQLPCRGAWLDTWERNISDWRADPMYAALKIKFNW
jgi:hypothetical protein